MIIYVKWMVNSVTLMVMYVKLMVNYVKTVKLMVSSVTSMDRHLAIFVPSAFQIYLQKLG